MARPSRRPIPRTPLLAAVISTVAALGYFAVDWVSVALSNSLGLRVQHAETLREIQDSMSIGYHGEVARDAFNQEISNETPADNVRRVPTLPARPSEAPAVRE